MSLTCLDITVDPEIILFFFAYFKISVDDFIKQKLRKEMSNSSADILELEKLCEQLYNANSPQQIHEANKLLEEFAVSSDCLSKCQILLDRGIVINFQKKIIKTKKNMHKILYLVFHNHLFKRIFRPRVRIHSIFPALSSSKRLQETQ